MKKRRRKVTDTEFSEEMGGQRRTFSDYYGRMRRRFSDAFRRGGHEGKSGIGDFAKGLVRFLVQNKDILIRTCLPALYCLLFGAVGFDGGIYPFGISAVCAAGSGIPVAVAASSAAVASLFVRGGFYLAITCAVAAIFVTVLYKVKKSLADSSFTRATLSVVLGTAEAVALSLSGGIGIYEIFGIVLSFALCPVMTMSLRSLFIPGERITRSAEAGIYALIYTGAYAIREIPDVGDSLATALSVMCVLYASYAFGTYRGVMTGLAAGLAAGSEYCMIYPLCGAASGILMGASPILAVSSGVLLALFFGLYSAGASAFGDLFPGLMFSGAVAAPLFYYDIAPIPRSGGDGGGSADGVSVGEIRHSHTRERLRLMSESLLSLASVMRQMARVMSRPTYTEMRQMCDQAFDESCKDCDGRCICWDKEYRTTASAISALANDMRCGRYASAESMPEGMRERCPYRNDILSRINDGGVASFRKAALGDNSSVTADELSTVAHLLKDVCDKDDRDFEYDEGMSAALAERFSRIGLRLDEVAVYGRRHRRVIAKGAEHGYGVGVDEIRFAASDVLGCEMKSPEYSIDGKRVCMSISTAERFSADFGRCSLAKRGERCGDSVTSFYSGDGYFYALVSDGMGSGSDAALTSGISAVATEKLIGAGCTLSSAMNILNNLLAGRNIECFTTVDLLEADLLTGDLRFLKSGAAPSFVLRGKRLFRLASGTMPLGIITPFDGEVLDFAAKDGDFVIMISDGVLPEGEDSDWLYDYLCPRGAAPCLTAACDLNAVARDIAVYAAERWDYSDDVTVGIVRIKEK